MDEQRPLPYLYIKGYPTWQTPELTSLRKLPARATFWPFPATAAARARVPEASPLVRLLNGHWEFRLFNRPEEVTPAALASGEWRELAVPGNWTMQLRNEPWTTGEGAFFKPHYTNVQMPFAEFFPQVPDLTATGVYRTRLAVPEEWAGQRVVLHFAGCEGALFVYLDGKFVGLNKDSRTPAEYDLTDLVKPGQSYELLCVNPRYSDASWLEDQDHWWQAGIHRDVYLYATPLTYLQDLTVQTDFSEDLSSATLRVRAVARSTSGSTAVGVVYVQLYEPDGRPVFEKEVESAIPGPPEGYFTGQRPSGDTTTTTIVVPIEKPRLWNAETPELYTLVVALAVAGNTISTAVRVGFRKVEIRNRELQVNGQPVMINGMNRHDHSDEYGKAVTKELMELDARTMKAHNVNAVRTSHYPNDPYWLDLCDEYGLYVVDEANIENHALLRLSEDTRVTAAYAERVRNMVERDKNHPSVIVWSLGNESGYGANQVGAAAWVRFTDPTRPIQYEGAIGGLNNDNSFAGLTGYWDRVHSVTDILNPMYAFIDDIIKWVTTNTDDPRPFIMCEYAHAMGNSSGSLSDYYAAFEKHHGLQGGFIWEWLDHGIRMTATDGTPYWVYGGDFGDKPNDATFVADGMVWPDRTPHPAMQEFKYLARPVKVTAVDARPGVFRLENRRYFTSLDDLRGEWLLLVDGEIVQTGPIMELDIPPQEYREITLPLNWPETGETFVDFRFSTAVATPWAPAEHLVAWDQLPVGATVTQQEPVTQPQRHESNVHEEGRQIILKTREHRVVFDSATGELTAFRAGAGEKNPIRCSPTLKLWRAPTDNDTMQKKYRANDRALPLWERLGLHQLQRRLEGIRTITSENGAKAVEVTIAATGREQWEDVVAILAYTLLEDGTLSIATHMQFAPDFADLPRVGLCLVLSTELEHLQWYGRGPWDNYSDRKASSTMGRYSSTVTEQYVPYIHPQEHGHKTDVRWLRLTDSQGHGLEVSSEVLFEFNALHHSDENLTRATHTPELTERPEVFLNLDYGMRGLGTGLMTDTLPEYRLNEQKYQFTFNFKLIG